MGQRIKLKNSEVIVLKEDYSNKIQDILANQKEWENNMIIEKG
jgi:hypothetical protein